MCFPTCIVQKQIVPCIRRLNYLRLIKKENTNLSLVYLGISLFCFQEETSGSRNHIPQPKRIVWTVVKLFRS